MPAQTFDKEQYGGFWRRVAAGAIDMVVLLPIIFIYILLYPAFPEGVYPAVLAEFAYIIPYYMLLEEIPAVDNFMLALFLDMALFVARAIYTILFFLSSWRATPGYRVMGIYLADESGKDADTWQLVTRYWGEMASFATLGIGYLMIAFTAKRQGLHDLMAKTLVYRGVKN